MGYCRFGARHRACVRVGDMRIDQMNPSELAGIQWSPHVRYIAQSAASAFNPSRTILSQVIEPYLVHG